MQGEGQRQRFKRFSRTHFEGADMCDIANMAQGAACQRVSYRGAENAVD